MPSEKTTKALTIVTVVRSWFTWAADNLKPFLPAKWGEILQKGRDAGLWKKKDTPWK